VDARRDHGFRVPRPDLAARLGVPHACGDCHADRDAQWAARAVPGWNGAPIGERHFAQALEAGRRGLPGAASELAALTRASDLPAIVRATAVRELAALSGADPAVAPALLAALEDEDALVRMAAAGAAEALAPADRQVGLLPLLRDPVRAVRVEAAYVLAPLAPRLRGEQARALADALEEYRAAQMLDADRPEARTNLGSLAARRGDLAEARRQYRAALRVGPHFVPASLNLAQVHQLGGDEEEAERVLRRALARAPEQAALHHALGLLLVRRERRDEAIASLERAARLEPGRARYAYVYGIALHAAGDETGAVAVLERALQVHPTDPELLVALATLHRDAGRIPQAREHARRLRRLHPDDPRARALLDELGEAPPSEPSERAGGSGRSG
jgi:Flp pilus assembly protein TadD